MTTVDDRLTRVAPWVTLWSNEQIPNTKVWVKPGRDRLRYYDEHFSDWFMNMLWHRERIAPGSGRPIFSEMHCRRQRRCMLDPRCQVCGEKLGATDIPWLMSKFEFDRLELRPNRHHTMTPPTCVDCQPAVAERCPHLRFTGTVSLTVASATPVAIMGDLYHPLRVQERFTALFTSPLIKHMIAKQLIVELDNPRVVTP